jgi:hypothetical protein
MVSKLRNLVIIGVGLIWSVRLPAQDLPVHFSSTMINLSVTNQGNLILSSRVGDIAYTNNFKVPFRRVDKDIRSAWDPTIERTVFFSQDTGFAAGSGYSAGSNNLIYHTANQGNTWQRVDFGQSGPVDDAIGLENGEAWLSVAGSGMAYTSDFGYHWEKRNIPEINQRFSHIFFNSRKEGIIGSRWDMLAYTKDNCTTWTLLPTPLDQKKYRKTNQGSRPEFNKVAIFKNYFLVMQEEMVFYSLRDSVDWKPLPEYTDFYTDPENSALFFRGKDGSFIRSDLDFKKIFSMPGYSRIYDVQCKNGSLFVISSKMLTWLGTDNVQVSQDLDKDGLDQAEPNWFGSTGFGYFGILNNSVYYKPYFSGKWEFLFKFPNEDALYSVYKQNQIIGETADSLFYYDSLGSLQSKASKSGLINSFCSQEIRSLSFDRGSVGCFHSYSDKLKYTNTDGNFESAEIDARGSKHKNELPDYEEVIDSRLVSSFVTKIPGLFDSLNDVQVTDLQFTETDYAACRKGILKFQHAIELKKDNEKNGFNLNRNNIDFTRLTNLVDSIRYLQRERLNRILNSKEMYSTTTNWTSVMLANEAGDCLSISSSYLEPNAFYFPWVISLNGLSRRINNIEINKFINAVYPSLLQKGGKLQLMYQILREIY